MWTLSELRNFNLYLLTRNIFPDNLVRATFQKKVTQYDINEEVQQNDLNETFITYTEKKVVRHAETTNVIGTGSKPVILSYYLQLTWRQFY